MGKRYAPRVKHIVAPRIQHHVTEAGPPSVSGVLKVVAILEQRPMMLNAKLIWMDVKCHPREAGEGETYGSDVRELSLEGGDVANLEELVVIVGGVVAAAGDGAGLSGGLLLGEGVGHGGGGEERRGGWREGADNARPGTPDGGSENNPVVCQDLLMFACRRRPPKSSANDRFAVFFVPLGVRAEVETSSSLPKPQGPPKEKGRGLNVVVRPFMVAESEKESKRGGC